MPQFVLANRRSGLFTNEAKIASRACVRTALELLPTARVIANHEPADPLARNVVVLEADANQVAAVRPRLPADAMLEPIVRRKLHHRVPIELRSAVPHVARSTGASSIYKSTINGNGDPLAHADVTLYVRDAGGQLQITTVKTNANGRISFELPDGSVVAFVEPIPYFGCWIMLAEGPPSGSTIDCFPLAKAKSGGAGWWHDVMGVDITQRSRGAGIKVGVIDTGCGPHPNLKHVTLVGAFFDGKVLPPDQARDVVQHGTHTTGIVGARPKRAPDYAGIGAGCDLFHARAFKGDGPDDGPTQADIINSIDALSRDHQCDLINMSFGGELKSEAEEDAIRDAAERGTLCICSAGNENGAIDYPAAYSECEAVSAIGKIGWAPAGTFSSSNRPQDDAKMGVNNLFLAAFSSFGPTLACAAPGVGIVSTVPDRGDVVGPYMEMDGTSMASPAACGALAVILSQDVLYHALPRSISRSRRAALVLAQHCQSFGLPVEFEGRGLPTI
jgi:subtilisin family serine protease